MAYTLNTLHTQAEFIVILVSAAIRFFRTCIGLKDEFYNRYIVKNRCFEPLIAQLSSNLGRDNLVHSAILELLEFVRRENVSQNTQSYTKHEKQDVTQKGV